MIHILKNQRSLTRNLKERKNKNKKIHHSPRYKVAATSAIILSLLLFFTPSILLCFVFERQLLFHFILFFLFWQLFLHFFIFDSRRWNPKRSGLSCSVWGYTERRGAFVFKRMISAGFMHFLLCWAYIETR